MALLMDTPKGRKPKICSGCDRTYYDVCPRCKDTAVEISVVRDHNPPVIAIVINPNPWLVETFGPFEDLESAQEWALEKMSIWWPDNTYTWNEVTNTYENLDSDQWDYGNGIHIDVLEHPVHGK